MKNENTQFDERQLQIRGDIFKHGCIAAMAVLLLNAALGSLDIVWASTFQQNVLMLVLIITIVSVEFHIRGVYFGRGIPRLPMLGAIGVCVLVLAVLSAIHFAQGAAFIAGGGLTDEGAMVIYCAMFFLNVACGITQLLRCKRVG